MADLAAVADIVVAAIAAMGNELEASLCTFLPLSPLISNVKTPDKMVDRSSQS